MDGLLSLQASRATKIRDDNVVGGAKGAVSSNDEEVASDSGAEGDEQQDTPPVPEPRKRKRGKTLSGCGRDYGADIAERFEALRPYRNSTLSKLSERTKLASGKITNKVGVVLWGRCSLVGWVWYVTSCLDIILLQSFMEVDRSILSQIEHVSPQCCVILYVCMYVCV